MMVSFWRPFAPGNLSAEIQAPATVSAAPNGQAIVTAVPRTLARLDKRLGDQVAAGEILALVESRDAAAMAADRAAALEIKPNKKKKKKKMKNKKKK